MELEAKFWKAEQLVMMISELNLSHRKTFKCIERLKRSYDSTRKVSDRRDLPDRESTPDDLFYFRSRGDSGQCELCGKYVNSKLLFAHLKRQHDFIEIINV